MTRLGVNVDHVATIREARKAPEPDPVTAALLAELAGAHGITVHLRGDRRHIQERDVQLLREVVTTRLNVEMSTASEMIRIAREIKPDTVTLVPERPDEITTEGGLDVLHYADDIRSAAGELLNAGIQVSLFIDPDRPQIEKTLELQVPLIELNTAAYAEAVPRGLDPSDEGFLKELGKVVKAAEFAAQEGLRVLAGHGLTYRNVGPISDILQIEELNIGHNIVARAVLVGMQQAVEEMLIAMEGE
ncbi:MAG TPA: pyridoxine 5'-phosphate synthase [Acidobacteriota bacterium]|nr:pyridoxine 5'-phosphate synthase [Acidobacteriota bacterium]